MTFPDDHIDLKLRKQPKGVRVILQERKSVWNQFTMVCKKCGTKIIGKCASCTKSEMHKDAEWRIALAEAMGQDNAVSVRDGVSRDRQSTHWDRSVIVTQLCIVCTKLYCIYL